MGNVDSARPLVRMASQVQVVGRTAARELFLLERHNSSWCRSSAGRVKWVVSVVSVMDLTSW